MMYQHAAAVLARADRLLTAAVGEADPVERFLATYLAALRGAAAALAVASVGSGRPRSRNAWVLLARNVPEFALWADYFAAHSQTRAALEVGLSRRVDERAVDDFYSRVGAFLNDVEDLIRRATEHRLSA